LIFGKTGTLTYGRPNLTEIICAKGFKRAEVLRFAASLELYSKHPLASAVVTAAKQERIETLSVEKIREKPGEGLKGRIAGKLIEITGRSS
jgi:cation transport ATPase